jgi:hypothetical protein
VSKLELVSHSDYELAAWWPTKTDIVIPFASGSTSNCNFVRGRQSGLDTYDLCVYAELAPHERRLINFAEAIEGGFQLPPAPPCDAWLGGVPVRIAGVRMTKVSAEPNGAAYDIHYQARVGPMLLVHLFLIWYPDQSWCAGEIMICGSNPGVPDMVGMIPANFRLQVGDAIVSVPGLPLGQPLMREGDWLASGQTRNLPLTLLWLETATDREKWAAHAWTNSLIEAGGIENQMWGGNPFLPDGFDVVSWTNGMLSTVVARQHDWFDSPLDPAMDSRQTGAQGAQSFVCGPIAKDPTALAVFDVAARDGSWPMVHMEADGYSLDRDAHPNLRIYTGQPNLRIASDGLGKPRVVTSAEAHGYQGPEDEHWFDFVLFHTARYKRSQDLQRLLEAHATNFLFRWVTEPPGNWLSANRAVGWMAFVAAELFRNLADRELAGVVASRFQSVVDQLVVPQMLPNDAWWSWTNAGSIGASDSDLRAMPWQAEVMCVGMYYGGMVCGHAPAVEMAYHMAEQILQRAWFRGSNGYWHSRDVINQAGADLPYYDAYAHFGFKAIDVLLKRDPSHVQAGEIWRQRKGEATDLYKLSWFLPGVVTTT